MGNGCHGGTWQEREKDAARDSRRVQSLGDLEAAACHLYPVPPLYKGWSPPPEHVSAKN